MKFSEDQIRTVCGNPRPTPKETSKIKLLTIQLEKLNDVILQKTNEYGINLK
jgi:hypothetical protein